jgi:aerobic-type carbon monoxide dehydrogenase small subunit (CoxS/CutS family)
MPTVRLSVNRQIVAGEGAHPCGHLCRCTGSHNIVKAVMAASGQDAGKEAA